MDFGGFPAARDSCSCGVGKRPTAINNGKSRQSGLQ